MPFDLHGGVDSYGLEDVDQDILHSKKIKLNYRRPAKQFVG
jgi:hypothetical protein